MFNLSKSSSIFMRPIKFKPQEESLAQVFGVRLAQDQIVMKHVI